MNHRSTRPDNMPGTGLEPIVPFESSENDARRKQIRAMSVSIILAREAPNPAIDG
jgi:hypothetical protein